MPRPAALAMMLAPMTRGSFPPRRWRALGPERALGRCRARTGCYGRAPAVCAARKKQHCCRDSFKHSPSVTTAHDDAKIIHRSTRTVATIFVVHENRTRVPDRCVFHLGAASRLGRTRNKCDKFLGLSTVLPMDGFPRAHGLAACAWRRGHRRIVCEHACFVVSQVAPSLPHQHCAFEEQYPLSPLLARTHTCGVIL